MNTYHKRMALSVAVGVGMAAVSIALHWSERQPVAMSVLIFWLAATVLVPVEEWLFRGFVLERLQRWVGPILALLVSSVLFALAHGFRTGFLSHFLGGLALGGLYLRYRVLWPCITAHATHNATALLLAWLVSPATVS